MLAIVAEVVATTVLRYSNGFKELVPVIASMCFYGISFYFLSLCMMKFSTGVVYAIWSGVGIILVSIAAYFLHGQSLDSAAVLGMALIVAGVVVMELFSKTL